MSTPTHPDERRDDGSATVELALVLPVLLAVVLGAITYGVIFSVNHTLTSAAAEGARAAVSASTTDDAKAVASAAATSQLGVLGQYQQHAEVLAPVVGACAAPSTEQCITVRVTYPWATNAIIPDLLEIVTPDVLSAQSTVQLSVEQ